MFSKSVLLKLYHRLYKIYGPQSWWPAETPFEVMVGAVLTQNTAWSNVENAIRNLKAAGQLELQFMARMRKRRLAGLIRSAGYFNVKAKRLKALSAWLQAAGGEPVLRNWSTPDLRTALLSVHGIGPETADDILLYAFDRPVFVIDAYTRRLLKNLDLAAGDEHYEKLRSAFETALGDDADLFKEYHALIVRHAKEKCIKTPDCRHCAAERPF